MSAIAQIIHVVDVIDRDVILWLNQFVGRSPDFDHLVFHVEDSALVNGGVFMAYLWWIWFKTDQETFRRRCDVLVTLFGASVAVFIARMLQVSLPFHSRPLHTAGLGLIPPPDVNPLTLNHWSSMPSDHAVLFFALAAAVWRQSRTAGIVAVIWSAIAICMPRLYLGYHYPSDVVVGAVIGVLLMIGTHRLARFTSLPQRLVSWGSAHLTAFYCLAFLVTFELAALFGDVRTIGLDGVHLVTRVATGTAAATPLDQETAIKR